ncbi:protein prenylyltransferase [Rhizodiscina lignyota]|uniref:Protein farnesyltransferase/geranylgeranyltransferase type-1 subunit alpha n=1 Tax=Rhizodiscina lignyota TaxID=1504668 RepID=A0A9P4IGI8_9PEZI|nr:protein prenylyltransferase [Rhizodiscina lignyota]
MPGYGEDPEWSDIVPLPQDDGGPNPLAAIAYSDEYSEAMSYLRAVMAKNEFSERVLRLTEDIIDMNPAHYTVWLYRAKALFTLHKDLRKEFDWLNPFALRHLKNYQIWHHRHTIIEALASDLDEKSPKIDNMIREEQDFLDRMFTKDAKNYHVWSYRQWLVERFNLWDCEEEREAVDDLLRKDVRNNSAWNHRYYVVFGRPNAPKNTTEGHVLMQREINYAEAAIRIAPQNQSPWNYIRGILSHFQQPLSNIKSLASEFASLEKPDEVKSSHALDLLAEIYKEERQLDCAGKAWDLLAQKYDPIRSRYWMWKKEQLGTAAA